MKKHIAYLKKLNACGGAVEWAAEFTTLQKAWDVCERGDWMLWLVGKQSGKPESTSRKKLVLTACKCVKPVLKHIPKNEKRPLKAIQIAEKWAKGDDSISLQNIRHAVVAASSAAYAAAAAYAAYAAAAAAYAASSAAAAAYAASSSAAASAAAYAAAAAAAASSSSAASSAAASAAAYAAASSSSYAASAAAAAAAVYADADARTKTLKQCADIVRKDYPKIRIK